MTPSASNIKVTSPTPIHPITYNIAHKTHIESNPTIMSTPSNNDLPTLQRVLKTTTRLARKAQTNVLGSAVIVNATIASRKAGTAALKAVRDKLQQLKEKNRVLQLKRKVIGAAEKALVAVLEERGKEVERLEERVEEMKRMIRVIRA